MREESTQFFRSLLEAAGPSGDERAAARVWRGYAEGFADVRVDGLGSSFAAVNNGASPHVAVFGHIDEIGLVVTHVDDEGFVWFDRVGGWDPQVLVGQRVRLLARSGPIAGVIGKKAIHLMEQEDREKASRIRDLWIDIGAESGEDARRRVRTGDLAVLEQPVIELGSTRLASRANDNRCGAFVAVEAARLYGESPAGASFTAVASVQEETSFAGAYTGAFASRPDVAIAVDVTHTTDYPESEKRRGSDIKLGGGPSLARGAGVNVAVFDLLIETAEAEGIAYQLDWAGGTTGTDADAVHLTRAGVPTAVVSVPNRYMHSPSETIDLRDLEATADLVAAFARRLQAVPSLA
jgi:putative aminopeptidase FrvX